MNKPFFSPPLTKHLQRFHVCLKLLAFRIVSGSMYSIIERIITTAVTWYYWNVKPLNYTNKRSAPTSRGISAKWEILVRSSLYLTKSWNWGTSWTNVGHNFKALLRVLSPFIVPFSNIIGDNRYVRNLINTYVQCVDSIGIFRWGSLNFISLDKYILSR